MNSSLLFLTSEDFTIMRGGKGGDVMCHSIPGFSLILFYSTQCVHCKGLIPIFKNLPGSIGGCQFGMLNVSTNKNYVRMAKNTIAPINYVPYIVLYINGRPFMKYQGPHNMDEIRRFIIEVASKVQNKQSFDKSKVKDSEGSIPAYCTGQPLYGDDKVCYLVYDGAYDVKATTKQTPKYSGYDDAYNGKSTQQRSQQTHNFQR